MPDPLHYRPLRPHEPVDPARWGDASLHVVALHGAHLRLALPARWISLWLPLGGDIEFESAGCRWLLPRGEFMLWREGALQAGARRDAWCLVACGGADAWSRHLQPRPGDPEVELFPRQAPCPPAIRRLAVRLARCARDGHATGNDAAGTATSMLCEALVEHQRDLESLLPRCSGRTLQRRRQTLLRLLRVRNLILRHGDGRLELARLAASASYSPSHLIRAYREAFGETPSESAARLRFERAWRLVRETDTPVCEITAALGFESQSAFCRAFKSAFGMTTGQARRAA